jgi:hypothetical protein
LQGFASRSRTIPAASAPGPFHWQVLVANGLVGAIHFALFLAGHTKRCFIFAENTA